MTTFTVGQTVVVDPDAGFADKYDGRVFTVRQVPRGAAGVNYILADTVPGQRGLKIRGDYLVAYDPANPPTRTPTTGGDAYADFLANRPPATGSVVTVSGPGWHEDPSILWVVTGESNSRRGGARIFRLGGDPSGRYYTGIPTSKLTVVPLDRITVTDPESPEHDLELAAADRQEA